MLSCKQKFDSSIIFFSVFCTVDSRTCIAKIILRVDYFATHIIYSSFVLLLLSNILIFPYGVERAMIESLLLLTIAYSLLPDVHSLIELFTIWNRMIFGVEWHLQFHIPNSVIFATVGYLWSYCNWYGLNKLTNLLYKIQDTQAETQHPSTQAAHYKTTLIRI